MEGPTPSSAVYYGSLSIHAGCFLLLRAAPLLEQATAARLLAGGLGAATALFAGIDDARAERREVVAGLCLAHASRHHRRRNRDRLVHDRVHPSGRTRLLSTAAVPERTERAPRSARNRGRDRRSRRLQTAATLENRAIRSGTTAPVPDRARARIPRQHSRPCRGRAVYATGAVNSRVSTSGCATPSCRRACRAAVDGGDRR